MTHKAVLFAVVALWVAACGGKSKSLDNDAGGAGSGSQDSDFDAGSDPDRNMVKAEELCERLSTVQCAGEAACCEEPGRTVKECKTAMFDGCRKTLRLNDIAARDEAGFDADHAQAAFEKFEALAKKCDTEIALWGSSVDGLRGILQGVTNEGGNCAPRGSVTDVAVVGAALASCKQPEAFACQPRSTMLSGRPDWTCDAKVEKGENCFTDDNCQDGLYCDNPKRQLGAVCKERKAKGEACMLPNECDSLACVDEKCTAQTVEAAYCLER